MPRPLLLPIFALAAFVFLAGTSAKGDEMTVSPTFTAVSPALFSKPGALANAWADFDGDGDLDLAVSMKSGAILLFVNEEGAFREGGADFGLPRAGDELRGLSWGDFDGDGDPDLFAGSNVSPIPSRSYLFRNDGDRFVELALDAGAAVPGRASRQANWIDFDGDGDLDLYAANRAGANRLLRNQLSQGAPGFEALPYGFGTVDIRRTVGACWFDADGDGDLDLFLANQSGDSDAFWRNDGDRFVEIAESLGIDQTERSLAEGGVACAPGDYDNDGDLDLYVGTYGENHLYRSTLSEGAFGFVDEARSAGLLEPANVVGAAWGDVDNDGDLDLFLASYVRDQSGAQVPANRLLINDGAGAFVNVLTSRALINAADHGVVWVDFDQDGDLDLSLTDGYGPVGGAPVFRNELAAKDRERSLYVRVLSEDGVANQAGATLLLRDGDGHALGMRMITTGGGYNSQSEVGAFLVRPPSCLGCELEVRFVGDTTPFVFALPGLGVSGLEIRGRSYRTLP